MSPRSAPPDDPRGPDAVAAVARALADPMRVELLALLSADTELSVTELAAQLSVSQARASTQLAILRASGLVTVTAQGRHRTYRLANARLADALYSLAELADDGEVTVKRRRHRPIRSAAYRNARSCYDHLAGVEGVEFIDGLVRAGWLKPAQTGAAFDVTPRGTRELAVRSIDCDSLRKQRRKFAFGCLDWTEQRNHLGGALANAILDRLQTDAFVERIPGQRTIVVLRPLGDWIAARP